MGQKHIKEQIKKLQEIDPLKVAEEITGESYKTSDETTWTGMAIQMDKSRLMNELMDHTDDTKFSETTEDYKRKIESFGFVQVLREDFTSKLSERDEPRQESLYVYWHDEYSILLVFDTFRGHRNGGHFYYNWSPDRDAFRDGTNLTSSGGYRGFYWNDEFSEQFPNPVQSPNWDFDSESYEEYKAKQDEWYKNDVEYRDANKLRPLWVGDHDCREAVKNNISMMAERGVFLKKWQHRPFIWLLHHMDTKTEGYSHEDITESRIAKLPDYVRQRINAQS